MPGHGRRRFQAQMLELELSTLGALDMALGQVGRAMDALEHADERLAAFVVADDERIEGRCLEVHQAILSLLALQAPVAGDLRVVAAVLYAIAGIERVGDQCVNIAKLIPLAPPPLRCAELRDRILSMGARARDALAQARVAFGERDVALARALTGSDRELERANHEVFRLAVLAGEDPDAREWAMTTTLVARALERIGHNATDIAQQAIYMATGDLPGRAPAGRIGS